MGPLWLLAFAGLLLCAVLWMWLVGWGSGEPTPGASEATSDSGLERERWSALLRALEDEIAAREQLASEVAYLRDALAGAGLLHEADGPLRDAAFPEGLEDSSEEAIGADPSLPARPPPGFDTEALVSAGLDPARAAALRERWEEHQLEKLYLRDQAAREGWMMKPRHRLEQAALAARLRNEMGEEDYAALLYATGKTNGVEVTDVLDRSPAWDAGLEPGDQILRYDGARVFWPNALRLATASGESGESVSIEVIRDGRPVTLRARRGPLGVVLRGTSRPPLP